MGQCGDCSHAGPSSCPISPSYSKCRSQPLEKMTDVEHCKELPTTMTGWSRVTLRGPYSSKLWCSSRQPTGIWWHIPIARRHPYNASQTSLSSVLWRTVIFNCAHPSRRALRQQGCSTLIFTRILLQVKSKVLILKPSVFAITNWCWHSYTEWNNSAENCYEEYIHGR